MNSASFETRSVHGLGQLVFHLEWCPKYRYNMLRQERFKDFLAKVLEEESRSTMCATGTSPTTIQNSDFLFFFRSIVMDVRMTDTKTTKELLGKYYDSLQEKGDFGSLLSDGFLLTGTVVKETRGREIYVNNNFFRGVLGLKVKSMIIEGGSACAIVNYEVVSPKGNKFNADIAEIWMVKNSKLDSVAIYFDTAYFQKSMS